MIVSSEVTGMRRSDHYENTLHKVLADQAGEVVAIGLTRGGHRFALISRTGISRKVYYPATPRRSWTRE